MRIRLSLQTSLRVAWYSAATLCSIAAANGHIHAKKIKRFWQAEKAAGRLPDTPRPHFIASASRAKQAAQVAALWPIADDVDADDDGEQRNFVDDDAPIGGAMGLCIPPGDPLLMALRLVHGADCWRGLDGMPSGTLESEAVGRVVPSRHRVKRLAIVRDAFVAALMILVEQRNSQSAVA
jgi:hypothetical protein